MKFLTFFLLLIVTASSVAHADGPGVSTYLLGPDDVIDITVPNHSDLDKELDRTLPILPDGTISYPEVGVIRAAGKTQQQLASEIQAVLEKTRKQVVVVVSVREVHSKHVRIVGAVKEGGSFDLKPGWRLVDVVAMAGGLTLTPNYITGQILHIDGKTMPLDLLRAFNKPDSEANVLLSNDDVVVLSEQQLHNQLHVNGEVNKPGPYDIEDGLSLLTLLSEAGGPTDRAALRKVYVQRGNTQYPFDLYPVLTEHKTDPAVTDFKLAAGDILFVPAIENKIGILGAVHSPGYYPIPENLPNPTVLQALSIGGGTINEADLAHVSVMRMANGRSTIIPVNLAKMLSSGNMVANINLKPDDIVFVQLRNRKTGLEALTPLAAFGTLINAFK